MPASSPLRLLLCSLLASPMLVLASEVGTGGQLTGCQTCCQPGGTCQRAYHQESGICCGNVIGNSYCCPAGAMCHRCASSFRCYHAGSRPSRQICGNDGGESGDDTQAAATEAIVFISFIMLVCAVIACARSRQSIPLAAQQGVAMMPPAMYPMQQPGVQMADMKGATPSAGVPVAQAVPVGAQQGMMRPGCMAYPAGYPAAPMAHPGYVGGGYSGGSVAMGAGMGFLGGMMMGEMMADAGDYGGGGYGGGGGDFGGGGGDDGGFAADM